MKKLYYRTTIRAPRKKVWETMLDPESYKAWTAAFAPGSYFEGSWEKGSRIRFLIPGGQGMFSVIADNRLHEFISIQHLGAIKDGIEDTTSPESKHWVSGFENYILTERDGFTELKIELDSPPEFEDFMEDAWPRALDVLKEICERP